MEAGTCQAGDFWPFSGVDRNRGLCGLGWPFCGSKALVTGNSLGAWLTRGVFFSLRLLVLLVALAWVLWLSLGAILESPVSEPVAADAVVVLGEDPGHRYLRGKELLLAGYANTLVLILPLPHVLQDANSQLRGVTIHIDRTADSTWSEAQIMRRWMEANGVRHVLVVSDPQHMLRVSYSWWSVFRGSGLRYTLIAAPQASWSAWHWWENEAVAIGVGMEVLKLVYYVGRYRFGLGE